MNETKPFYQSLGIMGPLASLAAFGLNWYAPGLGLLATDVSPLIDSLAMIVGSATGIWGRVRATQQTAWK